jgi:hypothetical protein
VDGVRVVDLGSEKVTHSQQVLHELGKHLGLLPKR